MVDLAALWRGKWWILLLTLLGTAAAYAFWTRADDGFEVRARLLVEARPPLDETQRGQQRTREFLPTQAEVLTSPAVIRAAIARVHDHDPADVAPSQVVEVQSRLTVDPLIGTDVLAIRFRAATAAEATQLVTALVSAYRADLIERESAELAATIRLLEERQCRMTDDINHQRMALEEFRRDTGLIGQGRTATDVHAQLRDESGRSLALVRAKRMELENYFADLTFDESLGQADLDADSTVLITTRGENETRLRAYDLDTLIRLAGDGLIALEDPTPTRDALRLAESQKLALTQRFGPRHPAIKTVEQQIVELKAKLEQALQQAPRLLERELAIVSRQEQKLETLYLEQVDQAKRVDVELLQEQQMVADLDHMLLERDELVAQLRQWEMRGAAASSGQHGVAVRILEPPSVGPEKLMASAPLVLGLGSMLGMLAGVTLVGSFARSDGLSNRPRPSN